MTKIDLGRIGVAFSPRDDAAWLDAAVELETLGYSTIWVAGPSIDNLGQVSTVLDATRDIQIATGIISVDRFDSATVAAAYSEIEARHPGRFVVGIGGAHGPNPIHTLTAYLDGLDAAQPPVPADARILAALGPRMIQLARHRAAGAYPLLVTPTYTAEARSLLGDDPTLIIQQFVTFETDPKRARDIARETLAFMTGAGGPYAANLHRMGFAGEEIASLSDRLVDGVIAWGDPGEIATRISEHLQEGANQVAAYVLGSDRTSSLPFDHWRTLAEVLVS